jgi:hypothetical protein
MFVVDGISPLVVWLVPVKAHYRIFFLACLRPCVRVKLMPLNGCLAPYLSAVTAEIDQ